jgi:transcriptional regulator with XRE-family HTH domain
MPGSVIKIIRLKRNLKQETVAKAMGISQAAYSKIENNLTELTVRHCRLLSRIFETNVYDYLEEDFEIARSEKGAKTDPGT